MPYIAPKSMPVPAEPKILYWPPNPISLNGGLNLVDKEWKIRNNQTAKVRNMWWYNGELSRRWGQEYSNLVDLGSQIFSSYRYKFNGKIVFHCGTKLYTLDTTIGTTTQIYTGLTAKKGSFFKFNGKLYYINGINYVVYDGVTVTAVTPYIPTIIINRTPTGGGNTNEQYNRLGAGFKNSFNGTGAATAYTLTDTNLDATTVIAWVGGVQKTEGVDFTVNRVTGIVTFTVAPAAGQNNVIIQAYKTDSVAINSILNCLYAIPFGGQNDNRVFFAGNGSGYYYWTGISTVGIDPTYWPYNNYNIIGNPDDNITGFGKQYDTLCVFKPREIYGVQYTWNGIQGVFNSFPVNSQIGCDCPDTIQNINNQLTWCTTYLGPFTLVGTAVPNQRNVMPLGRNVNPWLLAESNLTAATSIDFAGKYWLCVNDKVYLWDYFISPYVDTGNPDTSAEQLSWWYFDNVNASCWITDAQDLYYGHRVTGYIVHFHVIYDNLQFYDFGVAINAIYRIPLRDLGEGLYEFDVLEMWVDCRGDTKTAITVVYITSDDMYGDPSTDYIDVGSFNLNTFSLDAFTLQVMGYKETFPLSPMEKKIDLFGIEFSNSDPGRDMNLSNVVYSYRLGKMK